MTDFPPPRHRKPPTIYLVTRDGLESLPPGPVTRSELEPLVGVHTLRTAYEPLWRGMFRRSDQPDDLAIRSVALALQFPDGVLCGRSAALLWGDETQQGRVPEIYLPGRRTSPVGRRYRQGLPPDDERAVCAGLPVTNRVRTCVDLARWTTGSASTPFRPEELVFTVERMAAQRPALLDELGAYLDRVHSPRRAVTGAAATGSHATGSATAADHVAPAAAALARLRSAVDLADPASPSPGCSRARLLLHATGLTGFRHGHRVGSGRGAVTPSLADPDARVVVELAGSSGRSASRIGARPASLRAAGWTLVVVYPAGEEPRPGDPCPVPAVPPRPATAHPQRDPGTAPPTARRAARVLRGLWEDVEVVPPLDGDRSVLDPSGFWGADPGHDSGADGSFW